MTTHRPYSPQALREVLDRMRERAHAQRAPVPPPASLPKPPADAPAPPPSHHDQEREP